MDIVTTRFDATEYMDDRETQAAFLNEAFASGDPKMIVNAIGSVARAIGMTELAKQTGIGRSSLYKAMADDANPTLETLMKVLEAMQIGLSAQARTAA